MTARGTGGWQDRQSKRVSSVLILASLATYLIVGLITMYVHDWRTVRTVAVGAVLLVVPFVLLQRGYRRLGNLTLMIIVMASVTLLATVGQGIHDLAIVAYPIIFIYVGLTSDRSMLVLCGAFTFVGLLWLALGQPLGWFSPVPMFRDPFNLFYLIVTTVLMGMTALAVDLLSSSLRRSLDQSHAEIEERKRVEEALRVSEAKFRAVVENSHDGILFTNENAVILYRSPSYRRINGFSNEERLGRSGLDVVHTEDLEGVQRNWAALLADPKNPRTFAYRIHHKDGSWRWIETACLNLLANPEVQSVVIASRDITERKQAEDALAESEERFRRMFERHSAAMIVIDPETGRIVDANQAAADFYGWSIRELTGMSIQDVNTLPPDAVRQQMQNVRSLGRTRFTFRHRRADGSVRDVEVFSSSIELKGKVVLYSIIHDVTEQRKAEALLRQGEERYRLMFEYAPMAITITRGTDVVYANPSCLRTFGLASLDELKRLPPLETFAPEVRSQILENIRRRSQGAPVPNSYETVGIRRDGTRFPILLYLAQAEFAEGPALLAFILDISERKRAEEEKAKLQDQLTQAQKMESVGRLAGGVAHDFNNMLGVILGHTEMALQQVPPEQPLRDSLEEIRKASNHSADLTRQLLAFARRQTVTPRVIDLNETVQGMLTMLQRMIGEEINLELAAEARLWPVRVDPSQIDQMLANLCVNARDAIHGVGTIRIETRNRSFDEAYCSTHPRMAAGDFVLLRVSDDGHGMDDETLSHLFEPFFTTKAVGEGTGLGLATVYGAVKQNGGVIDVHSEPGHGSQFSIYLPRYRGSEDGGTTEPGGRTDQASSIAERHERILLVEDEPSLLRLTEQMLTRQGYAVLAARTPSECLELAAHEGQIHLLLTDVVMPEMNGSELAKRVRSLHPSIQCLFMSGYTADTISDHGVLDEKLAFIHKPFSMADLARKIRATLESPSALTDNSL